jgi:hypothetical protein
MFSCCVDATALRCTVYIRGIMNVSYCGILLVGNSGLIIIISRALTLDEYIYS